MNNAKNKNSAIVVFVSVSINAAAIVKGTHSGLMGIVSRKAPAFVPPSLFLSLAFLSLPDFQYYSLSIVVGGPTKRHRFVIVIIIIL